MHAAVVTQALQSYHEISYAVAFAHITLHQFVSSEQNRTEQSEQLFANEACVNEVSLARTTMVTRAVTRAHFKPCCICLFVTLVFRPVSFALCNSCQLLTHAHEILFCPDTLSMSVAVDGAGAEPTVQIGDVSAKRRSSVQSQVGRP
jgi:hypothetical protein